MLPACTGNPWIQSALCLCLIIQTIKVPAVKPTANVVAIVSTRLCCMRSVASVRNSWAVSPPFLAARLTTCAPSCTASATTLVTREACPTDSAMYSAALPTTVSDMSMTPCIPSSPAGDYLPPPAGLRNLHYLWLNAWKEWPPSALFVGRSAGLGRWFEPLVNVLG